MELPYSEADIDHALQKFQIDIDLANENIVFIQGFDRLSSAISFNQYVLDTSRLITLIGELHDYEFKCRQDYISVPDYVIKRLGENQQSRVLVEVGPGSNMSEYNSPFIKELSSKIGRYDKQIVPFDYRPWFLSYENNYKLYNEDISNYDSRTMVSLFIDPLYKKWNEGFHYNKSIYSKNNNQYLQQVYLRDLDKTFKIIHKLLIDHGNSEELIIRLRDAWKKVSDFYILKEVFKNDDVNEYIIVAGESHRANLSTVFDKLLHINEQNGSEKECVTLFETYVIS